MQKMLDAGDRDYGRSEDRDRGLLTASPPPPPPVAPANISPPPPPVPSRSIATGMKNMTPEARAAFIQAEARKPRLKARMQALGPSAPSSTTSPTFDVIVEDRLVQEAEEKAVEAEIHAEERERLRRERLELESAKALKKGKATKLEDTPDVHIQSHGELPNQTGDKISHSINSAAPAVYLSI